MRLGNRLVGARYAVAEEHRAESEAGEAEAGVGEEGAAGDSGATMVHRLADGDEIVVVEKHEDEILARALGRGLLRFSGEVVCAELLFVGLWAAREDALVGCIDEVRVF